MNEKVEKLRNGDGRYVVVDRTSGDKVVLGRYSDIHDAGAAYEIFGKFKNLGEEKCILYGLEKE